MVGNDKENNLIRSNANKARCESQDEIVSGLKEGQVCDLLLYYFLSSIATNLNFKLSYKSMK